MPSIESIQLIKTYSKARRSRDVRFDGVFFTAVKTTGIYCRSICPANLSLEKNVEYHDSAVSAANAGFRPCLRCRPDSAPESNRWNGTKTTFQRALNLINTGALQSDNLEGLAGRLGITTRYLRALFQQQLGVSPKRYSSYQQCLFAKKLLHETHMAITDIAFASGFSSVRQFNTAIKTNLKLTPTEIRKNHQEKFKLPSNVIKLNMSYRPPYAWPQMLAFLMTRAISGLEWVDENRYGRVFELEQAKGYFTIGLGEKPNSMSVEIVIDDSRKLFVVVQTIRSLFDLDAPIDVIDEQLQSAFGDTLVYLPGLRLPGVWSSFEAGVRAILGQQVSVKQAHNLVAVLVATLGDAIDFSEAVNISPPQQPQSPPTAEAAKYGFPKPEVVASSDLEFFRMPQARKDTLRRFAQYVIDSPDTDNSSDSIEQWLALKGIGPWTVSYVKLRAIKDPDVWLSGDAGIKNALNKIQQKYPEKNINTDDYIETASPWRSYLVFHLWNQL